MNKIFKYVIVDIVQNKAKTLYELKMYNEALDVINRAAEANPSIATSQITQQIKTMCKLRLLDNKPK